MVITLLGIFLSPPIFATTLGQFNYQGRAYQADGATPLSSASVTFKLGLYSHDGNCLLYEEQHSGVNLSSTNGIFNLHVGAGTPTSDSPSGQTLLKIFSNASAIATANNAACVSGATYTPSSNSARKLKVTIIDGASTIVLSPMQEILSSPYAMVAETLQGKDASKFVQLTGSFTQSDFDALAAKKTELLALVAKETELTDLANGTSSLYLKAGAQSAALNLGSQRITNVGTPSAAADAVNKSYADSAIGGKALDSSVTSIAAGDSGKVLAWDGSKWVAQAFTPTITDGSITDAKIAGISAAKVSFSTQAAGKVFAGPVSGASATPSFRLLNIADIRSSAGAGTGAFLTGTTCAADEALAYNAISDTISCQAITISNSQVTTALGFTPVDSATVSSTVSTAVSTAVANYLPKAGGTMSGDLNLGGNKITAVSNVPYVASNPTNSQDGQSLRWNNTNGTWEWFTPGVAGAGLNSLGGQTGNNQGFAVGTSGNTPNWSSASNTHTINIPMASGASVTAGLISNADYTAFNAKLGTSTAHSGDVSGAYNGMSVDKIKGKAVTPGAYAVGQTLRYDGSEWVNTSLLPGDLGNATGSYLAYKPNNVACGNNEVLKWDNTNSRWICGTDNTAAGTVTGVSSANSYLTVANGSSTPSLTLNVGAVANTVAAGDDSRITGALQKTGGTMSGAIAMGTNKITGLGTPTLATDAATKGYADGYIASKAVATPTASESGKTLLYDNTLNAGAGGWSFVVPLTSLNGATGTTQTFGTPGTSGTAPNWSTASNVHTLNIPMASTASVTAGLISKADYNTFSNAMDPTTTSNVTGAKTFTGGLTVNSAFTIGASGSVNMGGKVVNGVGTPTLGTDGVNKTYADGYLGGAALGALAVGNANKVIQVNATGNGWQYAVLPAGTITGVTAGTGLSGGGTSGTVTLNVNVGTGASQIPQLDGSGKLATSVIPSTLPAVSGANLTGLNADNLASGTVPAARLPSSATAWTVSGGNTYLTTGNVGVGTASPTAKLDVQGSVAAIRQTLYRKNDGTTADFAVGRDLANNDSHDFYIYDNTATTTRLYINSSGNVGIGTTNPSQPLDVNGIGRFGSYSTGDYVDVATARINLYRATNTATYVASRTAGNSLQLQTTTSGGTLNTVMTLDQAGSVSVGTAVPRTGTKLDVAGQITSQTNTNSFTCGGTIDLSTGNTQVINGASAIAAGTCTVNLSNLVDGSAYTIAIQGANATTNAVTFSFAATSTTFKYLPANAATTAGSDTVYALIKVGSTVYVNWASGY